jgi:hypothetical protein
VGRIALRPGRILAALEVAALWPLWMGAAGVIQLDPVLVTFVLLLAPLPVVEYVWTRPVALPALVRRSPIYYVLLLLMVPIAIRLGPPGDAVSAAVAYGSVLTGLAGGVAQLVLGSRAAGWLTGQLVIDRDEVRLVARRAAFVLPACPPDCAPGDWLTLPELAFETRGHGAYRTSLPVGRARHALRTRGDVLARHLCWRGGLLVLWSVASLVWLAGF